MLFSLVLPRKKDHLTLMMKLLELSIPKRSFDTMYRRYCSMYCYENINFIYEWQLCEHYATSHLIIKSNFFSHVGVTCKTVKIENIV